MMSSTPGIGLTLNTSGFNATAAEYVWSASYGSFLSWDPPDYTVHLSGNEVKNHGEKLYWTFTDNPGSTNEPVRITVTARDPVTHNDIAATALILEWEGDTAVIVRNTR